MAVRRVPEDRPNVQTAVAASAPGDRIEVGSAVFPATALVTVDDLTISHSGNFFSSGFFALDASGRGAPERHPCAGRVRGV